MKILHISDIHIFNINRHDEYRLQFNKLYKLIDDESPDYVVIVGDLFDNHINVSNESKILAGEFLTELAKRCKVKIIRGNHDLLKRSLNRMDSIKPIVELLKNVNIEYFEKSGFYCEEDIVWVPYNHRDGIFPWKDINHNKDNNKVYISMYHNPIKGCEAYNNYKMTSDDYIDLSEFSQSDVVLLGDIHKYQYFSETIAYSGSFIQQGYGECVDGHGVILWTIDKNKEVSSKFVEIPNEHVFINIYVDKITSIKDVILPKYKCEVSVKIHWKDFQKNINNYNEKILEELVYSNYSNIKEIKFKREVIKIDVSETETIQTSTNITNREIRLNIFKEYLSINKYDNEIISKVLSLDDNMNDRIQDGEVISDIEWDIQTLIIQNFKSYDKKHIIDFYTKKGIIQISGLNAAGKTTILDAICYALYGTTLSTEKREKYGDSRFINNKNDTDFCDVEITLKISGKILTLVRRTERKWDRKKEVIKSCSTTLDMYNGIKDTKNLINDDDRIQTQKLLDKSLGSFKDFIRLVLTNADNLNSLLSMDRAEFIDSIIRDAGLDLFEKRLSEFKEYKKNIIQNRILINCDETQTSLNLCEEDNIEIKNLVKNIKSSILDLNTNLTYLNNRRDDLLRKIQKIDDSIISIDIKSMKDLLFKMNSMIESYKDTTSSLTHQLKDFSIDNYDEVMLEKLRFENVKISEDLTDLKLNKTDYERETEREELKLDRVNEKFNELITKEKSNLLLDIIKLENKVKNIENDIKDLKNNKIAELNNNINNIDKSIQNIINDKSSFINKQIKLLEIDVNKEENKISTLTAEIEGIKNNGILIKKEIKTLEESDMCVYCGRPMEKEHIEHSQLKITELKDDLLKKYELVKVKQKEKLDVKDNITNIKTKIENINKELDLSSFEIKISSLEEDKNVLSNIIKNNNFPDIELEIETLNSNILELKVEMDNKIKLKRSEDSLIIEQSTELIEFRNAKLKLEEDIKLKQTYRNNKSMDILESIKTKEIRLSKVKDEITIILKDKEIVERRNLITKEIIDLTIKQEELIQKKDKCAENIDTYNKYIIIIEDNKIFENEIAELDKSITLFKNDLDSNNSELVTLKEKYRTNEENKNKLKQLIILSDEYNKEDSLFTAYLKCVSRDGIPTYLLNKSKHLINDEMDVLLSEQKFSVYFDDSLVLKMFHRNTLTSRSVQGAIESSGMERTFIACSLKMALRTINNISKPNFVFFDEIMGKLIGESVSDFVSFLRIVANRVGKLLIIEHNHELDPDYVLQIALDENNFSTIEEI